MRVVGSPALRRSVPLLPALLSIILLPLIGVLWLKARNGQAYHVVWRRELVKEPRSVGRPFYHGGRVYVPDSGGNLFALDARGGRTLWTFRIGDDWAGVIPRFVVEGVLYCSANNAYVYAIDIASGKKRWAFKLASSAGTPGMDGDVVYATAPSSGIVYALDRRDGRLLWKTDVKWSIISQPIVSGDDVYLFSQRFPIYGDYRRSRPQRLDKNLRLHRLDKTTGRVIEEKNLGEKLFLLVRAGVSFPTASEARSLVFYREDTGMLYRWRPWWQRLRRIGALPSRDITPHTALLSGERLYVVWDREVRAYRVASRQLLWKQPVRGGTYGLTVIDDTLFATSFVPCNEGHFYAIDTRTGTVRWYLNGRMKRSLPVKGGDMLYFTDSKGGVNAVRKNRGGR